MLDDGQALAGLTVTEKRELLLLLEERERRMAEWPEDTRPPLSEMVEKVKQECAANSEDPEAWLTADERHNERRRHHLELLKQEYGLDSFDSAASWGRRYYAAWSEATKRAEADGFPAADKVVPRRSFSRGIPQATGLH